ncbi:MAG: 2-polyprenylphenol 6-hydroxylase, partial [Stellaceae bacterium]
EEWMRANRGPEARIREAVEEAKIHLERLPATLRRLEELVRVIDEEGGVPLHPAALEALAKRGALEILGLPLWLIAAALIAIAIALW